MKIELALNPFVSFEGEGLLIGRKHLFIRLSGCPHDCSFCDNISKKNRKIFDIKKLVSIVTVMMRKEKCRAIYISGGEPLGQIEPLKELTSKLKDNEFSTIIQTSGYPYSNFRLIKGIFDYYVIDVKLPNHFNGWENPYVDALSCVKDIKDKNSLNVKVRLKSYQDSDEFESLVCKAFYRYSDNLVIQPVLGQISYNELSSLHDIAIDYFDDVRIIPQMQLLMKWE